MNDVVLGVTVVILAYLMGAVPTGLLIARWRGVDIRAAGSGNIGATNVLRAVGPLAALIVVLVDPLKGVLAVALPSWLALGPWWVSAAALSAVLGNVFNVFLRFRGGKGVATSLGVFAIIDPWVTISAVAVFALTLTFGRMVSLASLVGVCSAPIMLLVLGEAETWKVILSFVLALVSIWRHRDNLARLAAGTERRLGGARRG